MKFPKTPAGIANLLIRVKTRAERTGKSYVVFKQWGRLVLMEKPIRYQHPRSGDYWVVSPEKIKQKSA